MRTMPIRIVATVLLIFASTVALAQSPTQHDTVAIPAQALSRALRLFAQQTGLQIAFAPELTAGLRCRAVKGSFTPGEALDRLLEGSGLHYRFLSPIEIAIFDVAPGPPPQGKKGEKTPSSRGFHIAQEQTAGPPAGDDGVPSRDKGTKHAALEEVIVTGTHIRGETVSISPVISLDRAQIERSGFSTTDDLIRSLPQNFAGGAQGASPDGVLGSGLNASLNYEAASAVNLRGLGSNDTLVLLDGRRMAPSDYGSVVDTSVIPLAAISHIDIVTDGASAIYGADAVAGVVNFVLRQNYQGAETTVRYGSVTAGGEHEELLNQLAGTQWGSGGVLVDLQYRHEGALPTSERPFTEGVPSPSDILPAEDRYSGFLSAHQLFTSNLKGFVDALAVDSLVSRDETETHSISSNARNTAVNATAGVDYYPFGDWRVELSGTFGRQLTILRDPLYTNPPPGYTPGAEAVVNTDHLESGDLEVDGSVLSLPGGELKAAFGGTWRYEHFDALLPWETTGALTRFRLVDRHVGAEYAELNIPIVGADNSRFLLQRATASIAVRHDDYSDFGGTTNAKYAVLWSPVRALALRASYDTSFRAPDADELLNQAAGLTVINENLTAPSGQGTDRSLIVEGVSPNLGPETSRQWSAGLQYEPDTLPSARIAFDYYNIDFTNRIITPSFDIDALQKPGVYGSLVSPISSAAAAAYVANVIANGGTFDNIFGYGTAGVQYLYNLGTLNAAVVKQTGWDLDAAYRFGDAPNRFQIGLNTAFIDKIDTQFTSSSVSTDVVNTYANPLRLRMRGTVGWSHRNLTANVAENFSNAYTDTTSVPYGTIGAWMTTDVTVQYAPPQVRGFSVQLSAINLFNRYPPYVAEGLYYPAVHYDVGNADPQGRFLALAVRKDW